MKKLFIVALFLVASTAYADVIPSGSHSVDGCFKITNLDKYPDVNIYAILNGPMVKNQENKVLNNQCVDGGYKFNTVDLAVVTKYNKEVILKNIDFTGTTTPDNDPTTGITHEYELTYYSPGENYILDKVKTITKYNNEQPDTVYFYKIESGDGDEGWVNSLCNKSSIKIKKGDSGWYVEEVQKFLNLKVDGKFGRKTAEAVKSFQVKNKIKVDGVVGSGTIKALCKK